MDDTQRALHSALMRTRDNEVNLCWTRNQLFFLINSGALSLVITQFKTHDLVYLLACLAGLFLSLLWLGIVVVARRWVQYWCDRLQAIEEAGHELVRVFDTKAFEKNQTGLTTHRLLVGLVLIFIVIWSAMIVNWIKLNL